MQYAREEMVKFSAELRIKEALRSRLPPETNYDISQGDKVRLYRERSERWEGPFEVTKMREKEEWATDGVRQKHFNLT